MRGRALWARGTEPGGTAEASGSGSGAAPRGAAGGVVTCRRCPPGGAGRWQYAGVPGAGSLPREGKRKSWERRHSDPPSLPPPPLPAPGGGPEERRV